MGVGKTALVRNLSKLAFTRDHAVTIGVDLEYSRTTHEDEDVQMTLYDTAGCRSFEGICSPYYNHADVVVVAFAIDDRDSFEEVPRLIARARYLSKPGVKIAIVATKYDKGAQVQIQEMYDVASTYNVDHTFICSAKHNYGVEIMFHKMAQFVMRERYPFYQKPAKKQETCCNVL